MSPATVDRLYRAIIEADLAGKIPHEHGGVIAHVAWVQQALIALAEFERLVDGVLDGDGGSLERLRALLEHSPAFPIGDRPFPEPPPGGVGPCPVRPPRPFDVVAAGAILDRFGGGAGIDRALGYYLERAVRLQAVFAAADRYANGKLSLDGFAAAFQQARPPSFHARDGSRTMRATLEMHSGAVGAPPFPEPERWDPCTIHWGRCAVGAAGLAGEVVDDGDVPVLIGEVNPRSVCRGATAALALSPVVGTSFPASPPPASGGRLVLYDGTTVHPLTVVTWAPGSIVVQFPTAAAGCTVIYWEPPANGAGSRLADALDARGNTCANLFPMRPPPQKRPLKPVTLGRVRLAVVAAPTITLTANGSAAATAEACAPVVIAWAIEAGLCGGNSNVFPPGGAGPVATGTAGYAIVSLTANGQQVLQNVPLSGHVVVTDRTTKTYTLSVETYAGATPCGSATKSVTVTRHATIAVSVPDRVHRPGRKVPVTLRVGCAAPAGGVSIQLGSSQTSALPNGSVVIPAGARETMVDLIAAGSTFAKVQLTAAAPGYQPGTTTVLIGPSSCLAAGSVPDIRRYGGEWKVAVTIPQVVGIHMAVLHTGEVLLWSYREGIMGAGGTGVLACVKAAQAGLVACDAAWASARSACESAYASQIAGCNATFPCRTANQCNTVNCPPCTGGGPQRWACEAGRPLCLAVCHAARIACEAARWLCKAGAEALRGLCHSAAWASMASCKIGTVAGAAACSVVAGGQTFRNWLLGRIPAPDELEYNVAHASRASCVIWNPKTNAVTNVPLGRNLFCAGHAFLSDGRLFAAAGQFPAPLLDGTPLNSSQAGRGAAWDLNVFDPVSRTWTRLPDMDAGRWYPTVVTLADGRLLVMSGNNAIFAGAGGTQDSVQVFTLSGNSVTKDPLEPLPGRSAGRVFPWCEDWHFYHLYPFAHLLPTRRVFVHWKRRTADYLPERPPGSFPWLWHWQGPLYGGPCGYGRDWKWTRHPFSRTGPGPGTSVILPLKPTRQPNGAVTYPEARIMIVGGGGREGESDPVVAGEVQDLKNTDPATNTSEILDYGALDMWGVPTWRWTGKDQANPSSMRHGRVMPDTVLLPDGKVLVVNGAKKGRSGGFLIHFGQPLGASDPALHAEIFDPDEEEWDELCAATVPRLYHATAVLLPDARIAVAGHDGFLNMPQPNASRYEVEVFSPPYLFRGPRPVITAMPQSVSYGSAFTVSVDDATKVASVALLRGHSVTHQTNTDQRYVGLAIHPGTDPKKLSLQAPPHGGIAPPGHYMLFVVSKDGVPSEASWMRVS